MKILLGVHVFSFVALFFFAYFRKDEDDLEDDKNYILIMFLCAIYIITEVIFLLYFLGFISF